MQCHTRVKSRCIGSINSSFLFKSADCLNKIGAQKQSLWLLLLWDYGKPFLYQVCISSSSKVFSANATALLHTRAVINASLNYDDWMPAFLSFSRFELISLLATAHPITRAVMKSRFELWWPIACFLIFSRSELISINATVRHATRTVNEHRIELRWLPTIVACFQ